MRTATNVPLRILAGIPTAIALLATGWLLVGTLDFRSRWETIDPTDNRVGSVEYDHFLSWGGEAMFLGLLALVLLLLLARGLLRERLQSSAWALRHALGTTLAAAALGLAARLAAGYGASITSDPLGSDTTARIAGGLAVVPQTGLVGAAAALAATVALLAGVVWLRRDEASGTLPLDAALPIR